MKKIIFFLFILGSLSSVTQAQPQAKGQKKKIEQLPFPELLSLFVDEKYEKCLYKAEKITLQEKTSAQALPYLFMSRCYYEISKIDKDEMKEKYPNASKDCLKYATKYIVKDKERDLYAEHEDYFTELRNLAILAAEENFEKQKYSQSKTYYDYLTDWDSHDAGGWIMLGVSFQLAKQKKEAASAFATAEKLLKEKTCSIENKSQKDFLKRSLISYATKLYTEGSTKQAQDWLLLGKEWFMDDKEYQVTYSQLAN
jgi:hypothetical protein